MNRSHIGYLLGKARARLYTPPSQSLAHESLIQSELQVVFNPRNTAVRPMRILYAALRCDYGNDKQGLSFEENAFFHTICNMGHEVIRLDLGRRHGSAGQEMTSKLLEEAVFRYDPDLLFTVLFRDELKMDVVKRITEETRTVTVNWFCDDEWRFESYSRDWARNFNWVVTTRRSVLPKYKAAGIDNVILSQWGCNHLLFRPLGLPPLHDVSFVGQPFQDRREVIAELRRAGFQVVTRGQGWPDGRASLAEMVNLFNRSRINLDFASFSRGGKGIKARAFEIAGSGGFALTEDVPELDEFFERDREVGTFRSSEELVDKVGYYLSQEQERVSIAQRGYERTIREHTYEKRLDSLFNSIELVPTP